MYNAMICTCPAYRLHFANSQMGYYLLHMCQVYMSLRIRNMYLSIYRLHYAKKPDGLYMWNVYIIK